MAYIKTIPTEEGIQFIDRNGQLIHFIAYSNIVTIEAGYDYFCFINKERLISSTEIRRFLTASEASNLEQCFRKRPRNIHP